MIHLLLLLLIQTVWPPVVFEQEYLIRSYTVSDGLPVNSVNAIVQDSSGFLYFSTLDGLARFDGYEFSVFNAGNSPGIQSNRFSGMMVSSANELWLLNDSGGITRKARSAFTSYSAADGSVMGFMHDITETGQGYIFAAGSAGLFGWDAFESRFSQILELALNAESYRISAYGSAGLIIVNRNGLFHYESDAKTQKLLPAAAFPIPANLIENITTVGDNLWVTGEGGLFRYSITDGAINFTHLSDAQDFVVWSVHKTEAGRLLFNTTHGFITYDEQRNAIIETEHEFYSPLIRSRLIFEDDEGNAIRLTPASVLINGKTVLEANGIQSGLIDAEGSVWISTFSDGVKQIRTSDIVNIGRTDIPEFENIYPVIQDDQGNLWAGSLRNGIYKLSESGVTNWNQQNSGLDRNFTRFLYEDNGRIYAGMWRNGLWLFQENDWVRDEAFAAAAPPNTTIEAMFRTRSGDLLVGTDNALIIRKQNQYALFSDEPNPLLNAVRVIREDKNGRLYLGTNGNGLTLLSGGKVHNLSTANSELSSDFIRDIYVQAPDTIWVATENLGLDRVIFLNESNATKIEVISTEDDLAHNSLHRILLDEFGYVWISSNKGIMRMTLNDLNNYLDSGRVEPLPVMTLNEQNGMANMEANGGVQTAGLISRDGNVIFPNQNGLTVMDTGEILNSKINLNPTLIIESVTHSGGVKQFIETDVLELPSGVRNIRLKLAAPNFDMPERLRFSYFMEGVTDYREDATSSREAVLTNLPPGEHTFRFFVHQPGRQSDNSEVTLSIVVPPFFHETAYFFAFLIFVVIGLIVGSVRFRTHVLEERKKELEQLVDKQTVDLKEAVAQKSRFFSGITHELKTPLSLILNPLDDLLERGLSENPEDTQKRLLLMKRSGERLHQLTDQILDVTKLNAEAIKLTHLPVNLTELTRQIAGQFQSRLDQDSITLEVEDKSLKTLVYIDPNAFERILFNLLSNAVRFSPTGGKIGIRFAETEDEVFIEVEDQGPGIAKEEQHRIFEYLYQSEGAQASGGTGIGLYLVRGLCRHMHGDVSVKSDKGMGATFTVNLKKGYHHFKSSDVVLHEAYMVEKKETKPNVVQQGKTQKKDNETTILLVEDNVDFRRYLSDTLSETYQILEAADGNEGLVALEKKPIDLVISDVMMPGMNGHEFVGQLRKKAKYRHLPVIFLSAKNTLADMEAGLGSGADIYLTKPIANKMLLTQVAAVLRRESRLRQNFGHERNSEASKESDLERKVRELVYRHLANPGLNVTLLADALFTSRTKLYRDWKEASDITLNDYIKKIRLEEAQTLLTTGNFGISEVARAVGYIKASYFSTSYKKYFGITPSESTRKT